MYENSFYSKAIKTHTHTHKEKKRHTYKKQYFYTFSQRLVTNINIRVYSKFSFLFFNTFSSKSIFFMHTFKIYIFQKSSLSLSLSQYIYIYICVCVYEKKNNVSNNKNLYPTFSNIIVLFNYNLSLTILYLTQNSIIFKSLIPRLNNCQEHNFKCFSFSTL